MGAKDSELGGSYNYNYDCFEYYYHYNGLEMEDILREFALAIVSKSDITILAMLFVIVILSVLLLKALSRIDALSNDLAKNSQTLAKLTELLRHLIYGRKR